MRRGKKESAICKNCKTEFQAFSIRVNLGQGTFCSRECYQTWRKLNKKSRDAERYSNRLYQKKNKYGLKKEEYEEMFDTQNNSCAICKNVFTEINKGFVDHDHKTGKVRGILCTTCNSGLGFFKDDISLLESAIKYLSEK